MCSKAGCDAPAEWMPVILVKNHRDAAPRAVSFVQLGYCDAHRDSVVAEDVMSPEGFTKLSKHMRQAGLLPPDKKYTALRWEPSRIPNPPTKLSPETDDPLPF